MCSNATRSFRHFRLVQNEVRRRSQNVIHKNGYGKSFVRPEFKVRNIALCDVCVDAGRYDSNGIVDSRNTDNACAESSFNLCSEPRRCDLETAVSMAAARQAKGDLAKKSRAEKNLAEDTEMALTLFTECAACVIQVSHSDHASLRFAGWSSSNKTGGCTAISAPSLRHTIVL